MRVAAFQVNAVVTGFMVRSFALLLSIMTLHLFDSFMTPACHGASSRHFPRIDDIQQTAQTSHHVEKVSDTCISPLTIDRYR